MTISEYRTAGFEISNQVNQKAIDWAEVDVFENYIKPVIGADAEVENFTLEIMGLAYCLILRRNAIKTRYGVERKNNQYGTVLSVENAELNLQIAGICKPIIDKLKSTTTLEPPYKVIDIIDCGIYIF